MDPPNEKRRRRKSSGHAHRTKRTKEEELPFIDPILAEPVVNSNHNPFGANKWRKEREILAVLTSMVGAENVVSMIDALYFRCHPEAPKDSIDSDVLLGNIAATLSSLPEPCERYHLWMGTKLTQGLPASQAAAVCGVHVNSIYRGRSASDPPVMKQPKTTLVRLKIIFENSYLTVLFSGLQRWEMNPGQMRNSRNMQKRLLQSCQDQLYADYPMPIFVTPSSGTENGV